MNEYFLCELIENQFPQFKGEVIRPIEQQGHDHRTFYLGDEFLIRICSSLRYRYQVVKEYHYLPRFIPYLDLKIPSYRYLGVPSSQFPYHFGILRFISGESKSLLPLQDQNQVAETIKHFLKQFHTIPTEDGIAYGRHNFFRGGPIRIYVQEAMEAIKLLNFNQAALRKILEDALNQPAHSPDVWVHGDLDVSNLLFEKDRCVAVIDFGGLAVGDPSCDYAFGYLCLDKKARDLFYSEVPESLIKKARGWACWKAAISLIQPALTTSLKAKYTQVLNRLLEDMDEI